jgi:hypothetical protein
VSDNNERPAIENDEHMIMLLDQSLTTLFKNEKGMMAMHEGGLDSEAMLTMTYFHFIATARLRTGSSNYGLLQDIADAQLDEANKVIKQKMKEAGHG